MSRAWYDSYRTAWKLILDSVDESLWEMVLRDGLVWAPSMARIVVWEEVREE